MFLTTLHALQPSRALLLSATMSCLTGEKAGKSMHLSNLEKTLCICHKCRENLISLKEQETPQNKKDSVVLGCKGCVKIEFPGKTSWNQWTCGLKFWKQFYNVEEILVPKNRGEVFESDDNFMEPENEHFHAPEEMPQNLTTTDAILAMINKPKDPTKDLIDLMKNVGISSGDIKNFAKKLNAPVIKTRKQRSDKGKNHVKKH